MSWDLATAKTFLGIPAADTTKDLLIVSSMEYIIGVIEDLLGRGILYKPMVEKFYHVDTYRILLSRYPVDHIINITGAQKYLLHHRVGWLELGRYGRQYHDEIVVEYEGGYRQFPAGLERALFEILNTYWGTIDQTTGAPIVGGGATIVQGGGEVDRISLADFGTVSFNYGATAVGGDSATDATAKLQAEWGWLAPWAYILQIYRSQAAPTIVFA